MGREMERVADLILFPISLFSGKTLAVSIALLILGSGLIAWLVMRLVYERRFLAVYRQLTGAVVAARKRGATQEEVVADVGEVFQKSRLADGWDQYRATLDFSDGRAFNYAPGG